MFVWVEVSETSCGTVHEAFRDVENTNPSARAESSEGAPRVDRFPVELTPVRVVAF